jgi:Fe2+ or Zn2+ uptake regulation protein
MATTAELDRAVADRLARHDLRYTSVRRQIVAALRRSDGPITLPQILAASTDLAQSSAYRNLSLMEEAGVVRRLAHGGDHAHFELAEELTEHHHHLICEGCGSVVDFTLEAGLESRLGSEFERIARAVGFSPSHHVVDVYGYCPHCLSQP